MRPIGLRARIILLGLGLVIPLAVIAGTMADRDARQRIAEAGERAQLLVDRANDQYDELIQKAQTAIEILSTAPEAQEGDTPACNRLVATIKSRYPWSNTVFIADSEGRKLCAAPAEDKPNAVGAREWFHAVRETKHFTVSNFIRGYLSNRPQITVSLPILNADGQVVRVAAMSIDLAAFNARLTELAGNSDTVVAVVDPQGTILARYPDADRFVGRNIGETQFSQVLAAVRAGRFEGIGPDGVDRIFAYRRFSDTAATISVGFAKAPIQAKADAQLRHDLTTILALALTCILFGVTGAQATMLRPLRRLEDAAAEIGEGRYTRVRPMVGAAPEMNRMLGAIGRMAERLQDREEALRTSENRHRMLAENTTDVISLVRPDGTIGDVSAACRRLFGFEPEEIKQLSWENLVHPDDIGQALRDFAVISRDTPLITSYRQRCKDGSYIWVEATARIADEAGWVVGSTRDISARKQAETAAYTLHALLADAIDAMDDYVLRFDCDERLVLKNAAVEHSDASGLFVLGRSFEAVIRDYRTFRLPDATAEEIETLVQADLAHFRSGDGAPREVIARPGQWLVQRNFRTKDGGTLLIIADVTAQKLAALELEEARKAAEAASEAKSSFLASMSHEIRTPMNAVIGFADLLLDTQLEVQQRRQLELLRDAGHSLLAIINDILDLSKIEAGKLELEQASINPTAIVEGAVAIVRAQAVAKELALSVNLDPALPTWIRGDATRLRQILLNLLSNAIKFTAQGQIAVTVAPESNAALRFGVSDTGLGIPEDRQHLLFQDFSQIDRSTTRRFGGTGLGLSICKRLAEAMGGTIGVSSRPGEGSRFWFTIPAEPAEAPAAEEARAAPALSRPARILVAEDVQLNQMIIRAMLKAAGHEVVIVENGAEAVEAVGRSVFDLVLMDMEMPVMDGIAATRAIRALGGTLGAIPILALSANAMATEVGRCREAGMNDHLSKPIDREALIRAVAKWSSRAEPASLSALSA